MRDGLVLIGDAAGWNDPITGQGISITLRDVRVVSEVLQGGDNWSMAAFTPYVKERHERMRRLRFGARLQSAIYNEFGPEATARRLRTWARFAEEPGAVPADRLRHGGTGAGAGRVVHRGHLAANP